MPMKALDPAVDTVIEIADQKLELLATEAGRYGDGLRAHVQLRQDSELVDACIVRLGNPEGRRNYASEVAERSGLPADLVAKHLLGLSDSVDLALRQVPKETQAQALLRLVSDAELLRTYEGDRFLRAKIGDHYETLAIGERGSGARDLLIERYLQETGQPPSTTAVATVIDALRAKAGKGRECEIFTRLGWTNDCVYLDLATDAWEVVEIGADGWRIVKQPPVYFRRPLGMKPLPQPVRGGSMTALRPFLNVQPDSDEEILIWAWLLGTLMPRGPFAHLALSGEQGAAKSAATRYLRQIIDDNIALSRTAPRDDESLIIAARNGHVVALENVSRISEWLSDALCRLSTGAAFGGRERYTDKGEAIMAAKCPAIFNGVPEMATRSDLLDRTITVQLPFIDEDKRRDELDIDAAFQQARGEILGALCDAASTALRRRKDIDLKRRPRMADFARWVVAGSESWGWSQDKFLNVYRDNHRVGMNVAIEESVIGSALVGPAGAFGQKVTVLN